MAAHVGAQNGRAPVRVLTYLDRLEAEAIDIMREVVAQAERPVMLYSIGKDSSVLLHLARKAFHPGEAAVPAPARRHDVEVPRDVRLPRRDRAGSDDLELLVHVNQEGVAQGIGPFTHGSAVHTDVMKTEALKQALDTYGFDAAIGGARRDEEKSRAKERDLLVPLAAAPLGPEEPAPGALAPLQRPQAPGRVDARLPALQLDRARRLALHPPRGDPDRAALLRRRSGRSSSATAR